MTNEQIFQKLEEADVLQTGHFLLTSGRHSDKYMQCAKIFCDSKLSEELCRELAAKFQDDGIELVIGPAIGAIIISYEVSRHLNVKNIFAERQDGVMTLRRGFDKLIRGKRVLITEDVITTGGTVKEVVELVNASGGIAAGVGCIVDRSGGKADFGVPYKSVAELDIVSYAADECPLCKTAAPLVKPGSRK